MLVIRIFFHFRFGQSLALVVPEVVDKIDITFNDPSSVVSSLQCTPFYLLIKIIDLEWYVFDFS